LSGVIFIDSRPFSTNSVLSTITIDLVQLHSVRLLNDHALSDDPAIIPFIFLDVAGFVSCQLQLNLPALNELCNAGI